MKKKIIFSSIFLFFCNLVYAQQKFNDFSGIWMFIPIEGSGDTTFKEFKIFIKNKSIELTYWNDSKKASVYGTPFTYYGFWDALTKEPQPNHISELKQTDKYIFFYDDLIHDLNKQNLMGYDSLGNLYQPTSRCEWDIYEKLPNHQKTLELYFNMEPDVYKKVNAIPDYVLISLKKNKEHWHRYLEFLGEKEGKIHVQKSYIFSTPFKKTKMYLLKGDEVEIIEEKDEWLKIRYYGKKTIEGWIKKSDIE